MKITYVLVGVLAIAGCRKTGPKDDTLLGRQLGESTASPGDSPSRPAPVTPDDPRVMNVSAGISPQQQQRATQAPLPAPSTPITTPQPSTTPAQPPPAPDPATSSTPVQPPAPATPPSTTPEEPRPGVFSPPPPPPQ